MAEKKATKKQKEKVVETTTTENEVAVEETVEKIYSDEEIKQIEADFNEFQEWMKHKPYLVDNSSGILKSVLALLRSNAKWTVQTAPGLQRIYDEIKEYTKEPSVYFSSMQLYAMWFFISKIEGEGLDAARNVVNIQEHIGSVYKMYEFDYKRLEYLNDRQTAANQQVPLSMEDVPEEIRDYDENSTWKEDWANIKKAIQKRREDEAAAASELVEANADAVTESE